MKKPVLDFLEYLIRECIRKCEVDPDETTVTEFLDVIREIQTPVGA